MTTTGPTGNPEFRYQSGLGNQAAYAVSGRPFASGSIDATTPMKVEFPAVTRWVCLANHDGANDLICAFSENGLPSNGGTNNFRIEDVGSTSISTVHTVRFEFKVTEMWFESSTDFDVIAGLTNINVNQLNTSGIINWSGSAGVG